MSQRKYDSTVARIAGNILSGQKLFDLDESTLKGLAKGAVWLARAVVDEVKRTEPPADEVTPCKSN